MKDDVDNIRERICEFKLTWSSSHQDPQGWTFNTTKNGNNYSFYALEIDHHTGYINLACITNWTPSLNSAVHGGPLYHAAINGQDGSYNCQPIINDVSLQGATGYHIARANAGIKNSYNIKIHQKGTQILIYVDDVLLISATDSTLKSGTYGPYTCSQYTAIFNDIKIFTSRIKK